MTGSRGATCEVQMTKRVTAAGSFLSKMLSSGTVPRTRFRELPPVCRVIYTAECESLSPKLPFQLAAGSGGQDPTSC